MSAPQEYWFNSEVGENIDNWVENGERKCSIFAYSCTTKWARDGPTPVRMINSQTIALRIGKGLGITCCLHFSLWKFWGMKWISKTKQNKMMPSSGSCGDDPAKL